jgi:hypothetical protein
MATLIQMSQERWNYSRFALSHLRYGIAAFSATEANSTPIESFSGISRQISYQRKRTAARSMGLRIGKSTDSERINHMKKLLSAFIAAGLLVGCQSSSTTSNKPKPPVVQPPAGDNKDKDKGDAKPPEEKKDDKPKSNL